MFVFLRGDGNAHAVHYYRYGTVLDFRDGAVPQADVERLLARVREPAFHEALRREGSPNLGASDGDVFVLSIAFLDDLCRRCIPVELHRIK